MRRDRKRAIRLLTTMSRTSPLSDGQSLRSGRSFVARPRDVDASASLIALADNLDPEEPPFGATRPCGTSGRHRRRLADGIAEEDDEIINSSAGQLRGSCGLWFSVLLASSRSGIRARLRRRGASRSAISRCRGGTPGFGGLLLGGGRRRPYRRSRRRAGARPPSADQPGRGGAANRAAPPAPPLPGRPARPGPQPSPAGGQGRGDHVRFRGERVPAQQILGAVRRAAPRCAGP